MADWLENIDAAASHLPPEVTPYVTVLEIRRMVRVIREAEAALDKIHRHAQQLGTLTMSAEARGEQEYIEDVAMDALGTIARGGDEQLPHPEEMRTP